MSNTSIVEIICGTLESSSFEARGTKIRYRNTAHDMGIRTDEVTFRAKITAIIANIIRGTVINLLVR